MERYRFNAPLAIIALLISLGGCSAVTPNYMSASARRYDAPYCDGLVRFYTANATFSGQFSDSSSHLLSVFIGYNIDRATSAQIEDVRRRLAGCKSYYTYIKHRGETAPLQFFVTRYRAERKQNVIMRLLAILPYRAPVRAAVRSRPLPPIIAGHPKLPLPPPIVYEVSPAKPFSSGPGRDIRCNSARTVASLRASFHSFYGQNIKKLKDYITYSEKNDKNFTYCSAYGVILDYPQIIYYKFTASPNGEVRVFPSRGRKTP